MFWRLFWENIPVKMLFLFQWPDPDLPYTVFCSCGSLTFLLMAYFRKLEKNLDNGEIIEKRCLSSYLVWERVITTKVKREFNHPQSLQSLLIYWHFTEEKRLFLRTFNLSLSCFHFLCFALSKSHTMKGSSCFSSNFEVWYCNSQMVN